MIHKQNYVLHFSVGHSAYPRSGKNAFKVCTDLGHIGTELVKRGVSPQQRRKHMKAANDRLKQLQELTEYRSRCSQPMLLGNRHEVSVYWGTLTAGLGSVVEFYIWAEEF